MSQVQDAAETSTESDLFLFEGHDPIALFERWFAEAKVGEPNDPNAMALATVDSDGLPDVRMVLLKGHDERGFVFYTNSRSAKGRELAGQAKAALLFHWKSLRRQVRVRGRVETVSEAESDAYFASRPRASQIGAWASDQSADLSARSVLEGRVAEFDAKFAGGDVPRPPHWRGYRIVPADIEFWRDRRSRLHERRLFSRAADHGDWTARMLYP
jgi:pyridoxamine 5'-phosphate oxidase